MKHCFTIFVLFAASPVFGQSGNFKLLTADTKFTFSGNTTLGDSSIYFYDNDQRRINQNFWDTDGSGNWVLTGRHNDINYDSEGNLLGYYYQEYLSTGIWKDVLRITNTYDSAGHQLSKIQESWNGSSWAPNGKVLWTYDVNGNVSSRIIDNVLKILYTYNAQGLLDVEKTQENSNGNWVDYSRKVYDYSPQSGIQPSEVRIQYLSGAIWFNFRRYTYNYNAEGDRINELLQQYGTTDFLNEHRYTYAYDSNHNRNFLFREHWENGAWKNYYQEISEYDSESNILFSKGSLWSSNSNIWKLYENHYYYYTEFVTTHTPAFTNFQAFPNPASTTLTLQGENLTQAKIFDHQGRQVRAQILHGQAEETIQLGNLPTGNYLLQAIGADGKVGAKSLQIRH